MATAAAVPPPAVAGPLPLLLRPTCSCTIAAACPADPETVDTAAHSNYPAAAQSLDTPRAASIADDERFMRLALEQAAAAAAANEVPVGAVLVSAEGEVLAAARNTTEAACDPTAHAEMLCIRAAAGRAGGWRLLDATLYVTLEPCPMCAGALLQVSGGRPGPRGQFGSCVCHSGLAGRCSVPPAGRQGAGKLLAGATRAGLCCAPTCLF